MRSRYLKHFTILPPTVHGLCEAEFNIKAGNGPSKIRELRPDTLAQMLSFSNCEPGSRVLCVDDTSGLLPGAILSRMGGDGALLLLNDADSPPANPLLPLLNLPAELLAPLNYLNWAHATEDYEAAEVVPEPEEGTEDKARRKLHKRREILNAVEKRREVLFEGEWDA
jgi:tRNA (adenine-N(1)-)-methyltransferase non-catalytic subunit